MAKKKIKLKNNNKNIVGKKIPKKRSTIKSDISSSQFRWINQLLYTSDSVESKNLFQKDSNLFDIYHKGYSEQIKQWPLNPLDIIIEIIKNKKNNNLIIADMGCGKARLASELRQQYTVHSFDFVAVNANVVACDIKNVPLENSCVDIVVFCLSLMGTNFNDFILEANRILKTNGSMLVAEVSSRFVNMDKFLSTINECGFKFMYKKNMSTHFILFEFKKIRVVNNTTNISKFQLQPCLYKRR